MIKLLIINCFEEENKNLEFNHLITEIYKNKTDNIVVHANQLNELKDFSSFSHMIISGSYASAYQDKPWNSKLENFIKSSIEKNKKILGICYGHQFLARTLKGVTSVKKSSTPEFGWNLIETKDNILLEGIENLISAVSHYDEVVELSEEFKIIAKSDKCKIHGFQYNNKPVFGIQFHPEYNEKTATKNFDKHFLLKQEDKKWFIDKRREKPTDKQNTKILFNFLDCV